MKKRTLFKLTGVLLCAAILFSAVMPCFAEGGESLFFYGDVSIPENAGEDFWDSNSDDYDTEQNLLLNLPAYVMCGAEATDAYNAYNSPPPVTMLTDGVYSANMNIHSGQFFKVYSSCHRDIMFDLTNVSAISAFKTSFLMMSSWGIKSPQKVELRVSLDGDDWYHIADIALSTTDANLDRQEYRLDEAVAARFVCFTFDTPTAWCGCDEFEVIGTKNASDAASLSSLGIKPLHFIEDKYPVSSPSLINGTKDLLLAYHSKTFDWDEEHFEPYVTYLDKQGVAQDVMFDGYLFLLSGTFPSGARGYGASVMTDWQWEIDKLFVQDKNIDALNTACGKAIEQLGLNDFKYKFYISLYYPDMAMTDFGDVDGDGISENFTNVYDRIKAEKWYIEEFYRQYVPEAYENLEFGGFYWANESIPAIERNITMLNGVADVIHEHGTSFIWIPYYGAGGFYCPETFGFDAACLQPNYAFDKTTPLQQYKVAVTLAKRYGMGVEIETHGRVLTDSEYLDRYLTYLGGGVEYGYSSSIHMYYQDILVYYNACRSEDAMARSVYDYTYQFIKETLKLQPDAVNTSLETQENAPVSGTLGTEESVLPASFTVTSQPLHGTLVTEADGSFTYTPDEGYFGQDSFTYTYNHRLQESDECSVTIDVRDIHTPVERGYVAPKCLENGKEADTVCADCGEILVVGDVIPATGHTDSNSDGYCDICGAELNKQANCSCMCHKGGFMGFIYKIVRVFWRLFGTNKTCECGSTHY